MKVNHFIRFLSSSFIFLLMSCSDPQTDFHQWSADEMTKILDSVNTSKLLAVFNDAGGLSIIIKTDSASLQAKKITIVPYFPNIVESLSRTGVHHFISKTTSTTYQISKNEVSVTYHQKIIHPSSNWQGQTPWQEIIVAKYPRLDLKTK